jgi:probable addiction module antidote protein
MPPATVSSRSRKALDLITLYQNRAPSGFTATDGFILWSQVEVQDMSETQAFDAAKYRDNPKKIAKHLNEALATEDAVLVNKAIGNMVRAQGLSEFSRKVGLRRDSLHRAFRGEITPGFDTVFKVLLALDLEIVVRAAKAGAPGASAAESEREE